MLDSRDVNYNNVVLRMDCMTAADCVGSVCFLHGAGQSSKKSYYNIRCKLLSERICSMAFDFIGHGETGGELKNTSLHSRTEQAIKCLNAVEMTKPVVLFGSSMGAYTAIKLSELTDCSAIILNVPAVYSVDAYEVEFGCGFSSIIRSEKSWVRTDAWSVLQEFKGKIGVICAEYDAVIPREIIKRIISSSVSAKEVVCVELKGEGHNYDINDEQIRSTLMSVIRWSVCG